MDRAIGWGPRAGETMDRNGDLMPPGVELHKPREIGSNRGGVFFIRSHRCALFVGNDRKRR